jgi:hypothetical protein
MSHVQPLQAVRSSHSLIAKTPRLRKEEQGMSQRKENCEQRLTSGFVAILRALRSWRNPLPD